MKGTEGNSCQVWRLRSHIVYRYYIVKTSNPIFRIIFYSSPVGDNISFSSSLEINNTWKVSSTKSHFNEKSLESIIYTFGPREKTKLWNSLHHIYVYIVSYNVFECKIFHLSVNLKAQEQTWRLFAFKRIKIQFQLVGCKCIKNCITHSNQHINTEPNKTVFEQSTSMNL